MAIEALFLSLEACGDQRDVHSFPTRRSSDLAECLALEPQLEFFAEPEVLEDRHVDVVGSGAAEPTTRSEEHTSELQSRQYLVCRPLLEKKYTSTTRARARRETVSRQPRGAPR